MLSIVAEINIVILSLLLMNHTTLDSMKRTRTFDNFEEPTDQPITNTRFNIKDYLKKIYQEPNTIADKKYTPSIIPNSLLVQAIQQVIELNGRNQRNPDLWLHNQLPPQYSFEAPANSLLVGAFIQKKMLPIGSNVIFFGDLHGDIHALIRGLTKLIQDGYLNEDLEIIKPNTYMVFLGDMIDYGVYGIDTIFTALQLRLRNPNNVFLCRGNHEQENLFSGMGFMNEYEQRYQNASSIIPREVFQKLMAQLCSLLPIALFIGIEGGPQHGYAQCCHGGIEEGAIDVMNNLFKQDNEFAVLPLDTCSTEQPGSNACSNFNWGDFSGKSHLADNERSPRMGERGANSHCQVHTIKEAQTFMQKTNIRAIFRGHQDIISSYKVTIPNIHYPIYPFLNKNGFTVDKIKCFYSEENFDTLSALKHKIISVFASPQKLYTDGFTLQEFKEQISPELIATFSNAQSSRALEDEGFGIVTVNETWEDSRIRVYVNNIHELSPLIKTIVQALSTGSEPDESTIN